MKKYILFLLLLCNIPITVHGEGNVRLISTYPSDETAFTQGFELTYEGNLLHSTGRYGLSIIGFLNLKTGNLETKQNLDSRYFGEGVTATPAGIWSVTWREQTAFLWDHNLQTLKRTSRYQGEGWGLAYDNNRHVIWMSNGSATLQKRDIDTFELLGELNITENNQAIDQLNELEYVDNVIYANIWQTNDIIKIDANSGEVLQRYNLTSMLKELALTEYQRTNMDVLNGIAHIEKNRFYITGKLYPVVLEVELSE